MVSAFGIDGSSIKIGKSTTTSTSGGSITNYNTYYSINQTNNITNNITNDYYTNTTNNITNNITIYQNTSEQDPIYLIDKATYSPNWYNHTSSSISWVQSLYTATSGLVSALGNWSLDKSLYTATSGLVTALGNFSAWGKLWTDIVGRPTHLSNFTNDIGNYNSTTNSSISNRFGDYYTSTISDGKYGLLSTGNFNATTNNSISSRFTGAVYSGTANQTKSDCGNITGSASNLCTITSSASSIFQVLNQNLSTLNSTLVNVTNVFNFTVAANTNYTLNCVLWVGAVITTTGVQFNLTAPTSPVWFETMYDHPTTTGAPFYVVCRNMTKLASTKPAHCDSPSITSVQLPAMLPVLINSRLKNGLTAGVWNLTMKSEIAGSLAVIDQDSYCRMTTEG